MNNELLKVALSELSVPEITEILHDVLRKHMIREDYENKDFYEKTYAISEVSWGTIEGCLLYTSPSPRDQRGSRMPSSA